MSGKDQSKLGDEVFATPLGEARDGIAGAAKGEFIVSPDMADVDEVAEALPEQEEFWRAPVRFGSIPMEAEPLGWDRRRGFCKWYPQVMLPTQVVERVSFGHPQLEPNRLFWGDNLHVMRQLPTESIDLIYIDPPFFSGKQYNVIFGDQNELRSFSDIWEAGMPGYLIWLNARLYEMKRLLKKTGTICVHLDWHASSYVRGEMDKLFGYGVFKNEIVWDYGAKATQHTGHFQRKHDVILVYGRTEASYFEPVVVEYSAASLRERATRYKRQDEGGPYRMTTRRDPNGVKYRAKVYLREGVFATDVWAIPVINATSRERIGYPTQKPEMLIERLIEAYTCDGEAIADFFCGGGTTPAVAQRLGRRWIACDQSRVAVAITADRVASIAEQMTLEQASKSFATPDFTVEHWGIYEAKRLAETPPDQFREFVLRAFGGVPDNSDPGIHGHKGAIPIWVGEPSQKSQVTAEDVVSFANAVRRTARYQQDNLRDGIMLAWAFRPDAMKAAQRLLEQEATDLNFIRLDMIRVDSPKFREHVGVLSTDKADYSTFLTFVLPPRVEVGWKKLSGLTYRFDVSETVVLNAGAKIINVQWDFDYRDVFTSTQGCSFVRTTSREPALQIDCTFQTSGDHLIACKVQDDVGGEGLWTGHVDVK